MKKRTISINEASYKKISDFCKEHTLVMNAWVEKIILNEIEKSYGEIKQRKA
jgi:hypothetical protein